MTQNTHDTKHKPHKHAPPQVHYTNPDQVSGLVDSSGFRLHTVWGGGPGGLRPHDMGVLALGSVTFALPPRTPDYSAPPNLCPAACTARLPGPLTLIWSGFHMHTLGKRMSTRVRARARVWGGGGGGGEGGGRCRYQPKLNQEWGGLGAVWVDGVARVA